MSAPNLILTNNIYGNTAFLQTSSATPTNILSNASGSGQAVKLNTIMVANPNAVNVPVSVDIYRNGVANYLGYNVVIPGNSSLVLQARDTSIYMIEGDALRCYTGAAYTCHFTVSYEVIS